MIAQRHNVTKDVWERIAENTRRALAEVRPGWPVHIGIHAMTGTPTTLFPRSTVKTDADLLVAWRAGWLALNAEGMEPLRCWPCYRDDIHVALCDHAKAWA